MNLENLEKLALGFEREILKPIFFQCSSFENEDIKHISGPFEGLSYKEELEKCPVLKFIDGCGEYCSGRQNISDNSSDFKVKDVKIEIENILKTLEKVHERMEKTKSERDLLKWKINKIENILDLEKRLSLASFNDQLAEKLTGLMRSNARKSRSHEIRGKDENFKKGFFHKRGSDIEVIPSNRKQNQPFAKNNPFTYLNRINNNKSFF